MTIPSVWHQLLFQRKLTKNLCLLCRIAFTTCPCGKIKIKQWEELFIFSYFRYPDHNLGVLQLPLCVLFNPLICPKINRYACSPNCMFSTHLRYYLGEFCSISRLWLLCLIKFLYFGSHKYMTPVTGHRHWKIWSGQ